MPQLITDALEIDLYECLKRDPFRFNGEIRASLPPPFNQNIYLPLCNTRQRYGRRIWFWCKNCNRRTSKLYLWSSYGYVANHLACRNCLNLKYASQYRTDWYGLSEMNKLKLERLAKQERRLWYDGKPTQFGRQYYKLREAKNRITEQRQAETQNLVARYGLF